MPPRAISRGLDVESIIHAIDDDLRLPLRLHVAAHHAERHPGLPVARGKSGNDRLERTLARCVDVGMSILQREQLAAILKHKPEPVRYEARAHAAKIRLNLR